MRATRSLALIAVVTFAAALVAGVGVVAATGPTALNRDNMLLYNAKGGDAQSYKLRNGDGDRATISMRREVLANGNGSVVGEQHWQCLASDVFWYCTGVIALTDAARTGAGDITFAGLFKGFNGESLAITGGTGAYAATRGTIVLKVDQGEFVRVLKLV